MTKFGRFAKDAMARKAKGLVDKYVGETVMVTAEEAKARVPSLIDECRTFALVFKPEEDKQYRLVVYAV